jgi:hypothetical protein
MAVARRAAVKTKVIDRGWKAEFSHVRRLAGRGVKVGIQAAQGAEDGVDLLDILIFNEFGTGRIPARPVMRSWFDGNAHELSVWADNAAKFVMRTGHVDLALGRVGAQMQAGIQAHWRASKSWAVPNAAYTIEKKGSDVPLIDNAVLINAVRWQLTR